MPPLHVSVAGVDLSEYVRDVEMSMERDALDIGPDYSGFMQRVPGPTTATMTITVSGPPDVIMGRRRQGLHYQPGADGRCMCAACEPDAPTVTGDAPETYPAHTDAPPSQCPGCRAYRARHQPGPDGGCTCYACDPDGPDAEGMARAEMSRAPVPEPDHQFVQDPEELPARLCRECGMWPDHHDHHVLRGVRCVCQDCRPADQPGGNSSLPGEHSEHGIAAGEGAHP